MNLGNLRPAIFVTIFFLLIFNCLAGVIENEEAEAFAAFIQELAKSTIAAKEGATCVFGTDEITKIITNRDRNIIILDEEAKKAQLCKTVYVARGREKGLRIDIEKFNQKKILTISIIEGFADLGGMVEVGMGRRNFELTVNYKELKASGVRLSALATSLVIN